MTKDQQEQRPGTPFTSQEAAAFLDIIQKQIRTISEPLSNILKTELDLKAQLARIEESLAESRVSRMEIDLLEAERERDVALENYKRLEEKVELKTNVRENKVDTQEKLKQIAAEDRKQAELAKKADQESKIQDLKWSAIKAVVTWGSVGAVGLIISVLWFFIQQYINRGSP